MLPSDTRCDACQEAQTNFALLNYEQELQNLERVRHAAATLAMRACDELSHRCLPRSWSCRCGARAKGSLAAPPSFVSAPEMDIAALLRVLTKRPIHYASAGGVTRHQKGRWEARIGALTDRKYRCVARTG
jgi:hypothetical protein